MTQTSGAEGATAHAEAEDELIGHLRWQADTTPARPGWAHSGLAALLLSRGRLFIPAPWPEDGPPPGEPGRCYIESVSWAWASSGEFAYVEGLAWDVAWAVEHAWCAGVDGRARDLTWQKPGRAYLGLPVDAEYAARTMGDRAGPLLYGAVGMASELAREWMRDGVPAGLLVDVGRPIPA
ncbi:hypothetical protein ACKI14_46320 [Streptomyces turgidiscabies]|uniref:hypothetical protein n=1 Tax=Streptomyces turgidiscabies TaxID=85558 RepID=UPI0038F794B6